LPSAGESIGWQLIVRRFVILSLLALGALATVSLGTRVLVPRLGDAMAKGLGTVAASLATPRGSGTALSDADPSVADGVDGAEALELDPRDEAAASHPGGIPQRSRDPAARIAAIDIPRDRVARLSARQLRGISATDALDTSGHAFGARLHGIGGLGVGLTDGDVVTSIDGRATATVNDATAAAIAAYASGQAVAHATVQRGGRIVWVTVHIPVRQTSSRRTVPGER
jgi:hypothetical protein